MDIKIIKQYINQVLNDRKDLFLVSLKLNVGNDIQIVVDGDHGASLEDCMKVSRYIENQLDREVEDFSLTVTTPDISKPIDNPRQYNKNLGKILQVKTEDNVVEGRLKAIAGDALVLEYKARVPKEIGKGKMTIVKEEIIKINNIKKATVKIVFNS